MIPDQKFNCPHCGAPGQTVSGQPEYSCQCRLGHMFAPQIPMYPHPYVPYYPQTPAPWWTVTS